MSKVAQTKEQLPISYRADSPVREEMVAMTSRWQQDPRPPVA